jgi:hypothetical protein
MKRLEEKAHTKLPEEEYTRMQKEKAANRALEEKAVISARE